MQLPTVFTALFLAAGASAWSLTVTMDDGREVTTDGTVNSDCVTYQYDMSSDVVKAVFTGSSFADTFELYGEKGCSGSVSYSNGEGSHDISPGRSIQSYMVY